MEIQIPNVISCGVPNQRVLRSTVHHAKLNAVQPVPPAMFYNRSKADVKHGPCNGKQLVSTMHLLYREIYIDIYIPSCFRKHVVIPDAEWKQITSMRTPKSLSHTMKRHNTRRSALTLKIMRARRAAQPHTGPPVLVLIHPIEPQVCGNIANLVW